jgi:hypothetical protein
VSAMLDTLSHLWRRPRPAPVKKTAERRQAHRRPAVENRALLAWRVGDETHVVPARIRDISLLGARLVAEERPPCDQPVWVRLRQPAETDWIEAKVARVTESGEIGLAFPGSCPYALYQTLVHGGTPYRPQQATSPEFDSRYWR